MPDGLREDFGGQEMVAGAPKLVVSIKEHEDMKKEMEDMKKEVTRLRKVEDLMLGLGMFLVGRLVIGGLLQLGLWLVWLVWWALNLLIYYTLALAPFLLRLAFLRLAMFLWTPPITAAFGSASSGAASSGPRLSWS
jgi:hypothetical protein